MPQPIAWLALIESELEALTPEEFVEPEGEVCEHEEVTGQIVSDELKRLHTLIVRRSVINATLVANARLAKSEEKKRLLTEAARLKEEHEVLDTLFWALLKWEHPADYQHGLGLRAGWKVVRHLRSEHPLLKLFKADLGL